MTGFKVVNLMDLINVKGESFTKEILSSFSCPLNADVEKFLKSSSIPFAQQGVAATHLVFSSYRGEIVLVAYFTVTMKTMYITKRNTLSKSLKARLNKFASFNSEMERHEIVAPLIAQLGKNYTNGYNSLINGDELLEFACERIAMVQRTVGGRIVYLECEDKPKLIDFYESNGFMPFDKRTLDKDETDLTGQYLVQMLKYMPKDNGRV